MRISKSASSLIVLAVLTSVFWLVQGCEKEPSTDGGGYFDNNPYSSDARENTSTEMLMDPDSEDITAVGQQVLFTVKGRVGPYSWSLAESSAGTIAPVSHNGEQAVYTVTALLPNTVVASDPYGYSASAYVRTTTSSDLQIVPDTVTLTNQVPGDVIQFVASGGVPPYSWHQSLPFLGTVNNSGQYTVANDGTVASGDNLVTVIDQAGNTKTAKITQQPH